MKEFSWQTQEHNFFNKDKSEWKLSVMLEALEYLGNPHKKIEKSVIHVAGTNGKGSVANFIKNILESAGFNVGLNTSPHLINYNERIYFNQRFATDNEINRCRDEIIKKCKNINDISFFEATTLIAIMLFSNYFNDSKFKKLDYYIFEVGLGGRLDATNIFEKPLVSVITSISFDHMSMLGDTLKKIAYEKGGIIKKNVPVFTSNTNSDVVEVLEKIAELNNSKIFIQNRDFNLDYSLSPSLLGEHQIQNATLSKEVCKFIGIRDEFIIHGISNTTWNGRLQKIKLKNINNSQLNISDIYLDGAHNQDGIRVLFEFINKQKNDKNNIICIFAALKRKDYKSFFKTFQSSVCDKFIFYNVPKDVNEFVDTNELCDLANGFLIKNYDTISDFCDLQRFIDKKKDNIIFIFGSLYFVGFVLEQFVEN